MGVVKLSQSGLRNFAKYSSMLAGNGAFSPSAYDLLTTTTLTSSAASVTFSGLGSYSGYKHLQIRGLAKSSADSTNRNGQLYFNNDETFSGGNYWTHALRGDGDSVSANAGNFTAPFQFQGSAILPNEMYGAFVIDILDFSSSNKNTTIRALSGYAGSSGPGAIQQIRLGSTFWNNTNAVTTIKIVETVAFTAGSRFSLYGLK